MDHPTTRVLAVLEILQARRQVSGAELAEALAVDRRSVRRYIAMLEEMGIPITTTQGRHGGYQLVAGFKMPPLLFTDDEALALSVGLLAAKGLGLAGAVTTSRANGESPFGALAGAQAKLERVMPASLQRRLRSVDETVTLELSRPVAGLSHGMLALLSSAAQEGQRTHLKYRTPTGEDSERDFDPYGLVYRGGRWYAVGHCHLRRGLRSFRLDRMLALEPRDVRFERPRDFDALDYLKQSVAMIARTHSIEVLLDTDLMTAQRELFSAFGVIEWTGNQVLLRSQADDLNWFARELARLPFDFSVIKPAALRRALAREGNRLIALAK